MPTRDWKLHIYEVPRGPAQRDAKIKRGRTFVVEARNVDVALQVARAKVSASGWELRSISVSTVALQELIAYVYTTPRPR